MQGHSGQFHGSFIVEASDVTFHGVARGSVKIPTVLHFTVPQHLSLVLIESRRSDWLLPQCVRCMRDNHSLKCAVSLIPSPCASVLL